MTIAYNGSGGRLRFVHQTNLHRPADARRSSRKPSVTPSMQPRNVKQMFTAIALTLCTALALLLTFPGFVVPRSEEPLVETNSSDSVELELGPGLGPNLMTSHRFRSTDELIDMIGAELEEKWITGPSMTRRYLTVLIAGEGCKTYVDNGDGIWVPNDESTEIKIDAITGNLFDGVNPFE